MSGILLREEIQQLLTHNCVPAVSSGLRHIELWKAPLHHCTMDTVVNNSSLRKQTIKWPPFSLPVDHPYPCIIFSSFPLTVTELPCWQLLVVFHSSRGKSSWKLLSDLPWGKPGGDTRDVLQDHSLGHKGCCLEVDRLLEQKCCVWELWMHVTCYVSAMQLHSFQQGIACAHQPGLGLSQCALSVQVSFITSSNPTSCMGFTWDASFSYVFCCLDIGSSRGLLLHIHELALQMSSIRKPFGQPHGQAHHPGYPEHSTLPSTASE